MQLDMNFVFAAWIFQCAALGFFYFTVAAKSLARSAARRDGA